MTIWKPLSDRCKLPCGVTIASILNACPILNFFIGGLTVSRDRSILNLASEMFPLMQPAGAEHAFCL